ncbi:serine hydrolase [Marinoscillum sp.]|uniref:serine hydrolase n=1 Tax=Marinoscillum sp. TaxID=2024838 RepID=UPI003BAB0E56
MKKIISLSVHLAIVALAIALKGCSLLTPLPDTVEQEVENALDRGFDGIIVYVEQGGESSLYSAGWKNRENGVPADPHDLFKIASISKLYIAVAAAQNTCRVHSRTGRSHRTCRRDHPENDAETPEGHSQLHRYARLPLE